MSISENQSITISNLSSVIYTKKSPLVGSVQVKTNGNREDQVSSVSSANYHVNISHEAGNLQERDGAQSKKGEAEQTEKGRSGESIPVEMTEKTSGSESPQSAVDEQIKELQQKIKEIKKKIAALAGNNSESAQQQREMLEAQLLVLVTQLMSLMSERA
ncbi:MAG: hypothetical protein MI892_10940 [Desulfobacterales bacterium]|nr:hypothetical protein [Desulfobacterales bacterium]